LHLLGRYDESTLHPTNEGPVFTDPARRAASTVPAVSTLARINRISFGIKSGQARMTDLSGKAIR
jgi:hypothetical protein